LSISNPVIPPDKLINALPINRNCFVATVLPKEFLILPNRKTIFPKTEIVRKKYFYREMDFTLESCVFFGETGNALDKRISLWR